jgi:hypothetical protein
MEYEHISEDDKLQILYHQIRDLERRHFEVFNANIQPHDESVKKSLATMEAQLENLKIQREAIKRGEG